MLGTFGECEVFSFHATKFLNCFEGGAVVTNNDDLAEKMRLMRNFGFKGFDNVIYLGVNGKMSEVHAAMGLTNLEAVEDIISINRRNYEAYKTGLLNVPGISVIDYDPAERNNYQYVVIEVDPEVCPRNRDEIVEALHAENIIARKYFWPGCHKMEPYRSLQPNAGLLLPETERIAARVIVLPTGQTVEVETVARVCEIIRDALSK
jgi:dTDP-4-amino-4,6-dideoxygalactose transaminase